MSRIEQLCGSDLDHRALRVALLHELHEAVPFDAYVWVLTDPATCVGWSPLAEVPPDVAVHTVIGHRYRSTVHRWTGLPTDSAVSWSNLAPDARDGAWPRMLIDHGVDDVMSTVFRDRFGCWGFLDLWRNQGAYSPGDLAWVAGVARAVTPALRSGLMPTFVATQPAPTAPDGPVVLLLSDQLELVAQTPRADGYLRALLPTDSHRAPIPAAALNVAAQLLAREAGVSDLPASARAHLADGVWVTLRADRLEGGSGTGSTIAVSVEPTTPTERSAVFAAVAGLSERETEVLHLVASGATTRELTHRLFVSEHTVQDHLKSIFAKTGVNSRVALVARATGAARG